MKLKFLNTAVASLILSLSCLVSTANAGLLDLNTWSSTSGGIWTVDSSGTSVLQSENGVPTYFLSESNYIDSKFDGTFGVETTSDDDFIGFVFGYNNTNDYILFDWKKGNQGDAQSGFTLSKISGYNVSHLKHTGKDITVLASDYDGDNGWVSNTVYDFSLDFTSTGIKIDIDGVNIFDVSGSFNSGKFGFYNYSQEQVRYSGITQEESPTSPNVVVPVPEPTTLAVFALALIGFVSRKVKKQS